MSRRSSTPVTSVRPRRARLTALRLPRLGISRLALATIILITLTFGACTLLFWYAASVSGMVNLSEGGLYLVRGAGLVGLMGGVVALFILLGGLQRATLPLADLLEGVERLRAGDYAVQVQERGPRELRALARAFNETTTQLQQEETARRTRTVEIARQLRTPLTILHSNLEALLASEGLRNETHLNLLLEETRRLERLAQDLRTLALLESGELQLEREPTDLGTLVRDTLTVMHREASARGMALRASIPEPAPRASVDPVRIAEVVGHLIIHALSRSTPGGAIYVDLTATVSPRRAHLAVTDAGLALAPDELPQLFEHLASDETGGGLGLPVAKRLVEAHGGEISATSSPEGGATIIFTLPLMEPT